MTKEEYLKLLEEYDSIIHLEVLGGWENYDYDKHYKKFFKLAKEVDLITKTKNKVESGSLIQDASFIGDIYLDNSSFSDGNEVCAIRVSHFGNFVTVWGHPLDNALVIKKEFFQRILKSFESMGYIYIYLKLNILRLIGFKIGDIDTLIIYKLMRIKT